MVPAYYETLNGSYEVRDVELSDIPGDMQVVRDYLGKLGDTLKDPELYEWAMMECVYQDMAKAAYKNGVRIGFVYFRFDDAFPNRMVGSSIMVPDDMIAFLLLGFFHRPASTKVNPYHRIIMFPHKSNIKMFKSMCTGQSLRLYNAGVTEFVLFDMNRRFKLFQRLRKLYNIRKVK